MQQNIDPQRTGQMVDQAKASTQDHQGREGLYLHMDRREDGAL